MRSSSPRPADPWHSFAFVSLALAVVVVAANAFVLAGNSAGTGPGRDQIVRAFTGDEGSGEQAFVSLVANSEASSQPRTASSESHPRPMVADESASPSLSAAGTDSAREEREDSGHDDDTATGDEPAPIHDPGQAAEPAESPAASGEARAAAAPPATATPANEGPTTPEPGEASQLEGQRIWSGGDSMSYFMTVALFAAVEPLGVTPVSPAGYRVSSGLWPGGPYDWFAAIEADMAAYDPDIAVFMVGANDANAAAANPARYAELTGKAMDLFAGRRVVWVGQPPMGREDLHASIPVVNSIFQAEAASRPWITYVDTWSIMAASDGSMLWRDGNGQLLRAETDGIHVTPLGGARMAAPVIGALVP